MFKKTTIQSYKKQRCPIGAKVGLLCMREKGHKGKHMAHTGDYEYFPVREKGWY